MTYKKLAKKETMQKGNHAEPCKDARWPNLGGGGARAGWSEEDRPHPALMYNICCMQTTFVCKFLDSFYDLLGLFNS